MPYIVNPDLLSYRFLVSGMYQSMWRKDGEEPRVLGKKYSEFRGLAVRTDTHIIWNNQADKPCRKDYPVNLIKQTHFLASTHFPSTWRGREIRHPDALNWRLFGRARILTSRRTIISASQYRPKECIVNSNNATPEAPPQIPITTKPSSQFPHLTSQRWGGRNDVAGPQYLPQRRQRPSIHM